MKRILRYISKNERDHLHDILLEAGESDVTDKDIDSLLMEIPWQLYTQGLAFGFYNTVIRDEIFHWIMEN